MPERRKVSIVGAGSVGATIAYASLIRGAPKTVALHDIDRDKVRAEVLDLNQGSQFYPAANVIGSDDVAVTSDSDLVVITAGAKQKPGQTRLELAAVNVRMCRSLVPALRGAVARRDDPARHQSGGRRDLRGRCRPPGCRAGACSARGPCSTPRGCGRCSPSTARSRCTASTRTSSASTAIRRWRPGAGRRSAACRFATGRSRDGRGSTARRSTASRTRSPPRPSRSSAARGRRTSPSASPRPGSSRRSCTMSAACCRCHRCSAASTASRTCACRCRRSSTPRASTRSSPRRLPRTRPTPCAAPPRRSADVERSLGL